MQIGSVVWEEFLHIHTYIHTHGIGLSIRVTLNTKPALQVLITEQVSKVIRQKAASPTCHRDKIFIAFGKYFKSK